jgi:hypothetical protein
MEQAGRAKDIAIKSELLLVAEQWTLLADELEIQERREAQGSNTPGKGRLLPSAAHRAASKSVAGAVNQLAARKSQTRQLQS